VSDSLLSELLTSKQVAELLQVKRTTVEDYARRVCCPRSSSAGIGGSCAPTSRPRSASSTTSRAHSADAPGAVRPREPAMYGSILGGSSGHIRDTFAPHRTSTNDKALR
jgi:hypothetical protein